MEPRPRRAPAALAVGAVATAAIGLGTWILTRSGPGPRHSDVPFEALRRFALDDRIDRRFSTLYVLSRGPLVVKLERFRGIDATGAQSLVDEGQMGLEALYARALSPYPGDLSHKLVARKEYRPRYREVERAGTRYRYYLLYATRRLGYGAVTPEAAKVRALLGWLHCPSTRSFFKVRMYVPVERPHAELEEVFLSLRCP
jgi:hypothetical protein